MPSSSQISAAGETDECGEDERAEYRFGPELRRDAGMSEMISDNSSLLNQASRVSPDPQPTPPPKLPPARPPTSRLHVQGGVGTQCGGWRRGRGDKRSLFLWNALVSQPPCPAETAHSVRTPPPPPLTVPSFRSDPLQAFFSGKSSRLHFASGSGEIFLCFRCSDFFFYFHSQTALNIHFIFSFAFKK